MADEEHLKIIKQGWPTWNEWRLNNPQIVPDLSRIHLTDVNLKTANLRGTNFEKAILDGMNLSGCYFSEANLSDAVLFRSDLSSADIKGASLVGADLSQANLTSTVLSMANLSHTVLASTNFHRTDLDNADLSDAFLADTTFSDVDLSLVKGLETTHHYAPSSIDIGTLYKSNGKIPEAFLRECGVPAEFISYLSSLVGAQQSIQFYSCFISYSTKDEEFTRRLYSRMRDEHLRVWFASEDVKGGEKLREQIDRAIQVHDRLLVVLSEDSLQSRWVETEIRRARKVEVQEGRRKLFPIRLVSYERLLEWECFDSDTGEDLAREVREYFIPDFSNWKEHDAFEAGFERLLKDLRAAETGGKE